jgi:hypothetical protein
MTSEPQVEAEAPPLAFAETPIRTLSTVYDHRGIEIGVICERLRDNAFGLAKRVGPAGSVFDPETPFLTMAQMQRLAFQVLAGNPLALKKSETSPALAVGFIAVLAAVGAGFQQQGESDAVPSQAS